MNFDQVIMAHTRWKVRFLNFVEGKEKLEADTVAKDNLCDLGQWIYGPGQAFAHLPEFVELVQTHKHFHLVASQAVAAASTLTLAQARGLTQTGSNFAQKSAACISAIVKIRRIVENKP